MFSIIIPTYNRCDLLAEAIQSVISQSYREWELLIIDDHSTDNTKKSIKQIKDDRISYHLNPGSDRSDARNAGITLATGDYLCILDDDDLITDNYLADFANTISTSSNPNEVIRTGFRYWWETENRYKNGTNYSQKIHKNPVHFAATTMTGIWSLCIPKTILNQHLQLRFPSQFPHWQDTYFILQLLAYTPLKQLNNHNYIYRQHQQMGSIAHFTHETFKQRAKLNTDAIIHFFDNHSSLVKEYLPNNIKQQLLAEKYIDQANNAIPILGKRQSLLYLQNSLKHGLYIKLWKYYAVFLRCFLSRTLHHMWNILFKSS